MAQEIDPNTLYVLYRSADAKNPKDSLFAAFKFDQRGGGSLSETYVGAWCVSAWGCGKRVAKDLHKLLGEADTNKISQEISDTIQVEEEDNSITTYRKMTPEEQIKFWMGYSRQMTDLYIAVLSNLPTAPRTPKFDLQDRR